MAENALALYVHWPFCVSKCPYCDFNSHVRETVDSNHWQEALLADMAFEASLTSGRRLGSIFFGGGTPSLMPPALVEALIGKAASLWEFVPDMEITLEANPSSVEAARFADLASAGVNRASIGIQAFDDRQLDFLGRAHSAKEARAALDTAMSHFGRVSFDMIYALPEQSEADWQRALADALSIGTGHLSLYQLTIEPGTRFATLAAKGQLHLPAEEQAADMFQMTQELTAKAGLPAYEISNHAIPGQESRHNLTYWEYGDYAGIGPGAHGRRCGYATERHKKPENYLAAVQRNRHGLRSETALKSSEQAVEAIMMGLRMQEGVEAADICDRFGLEMAQILDMDAIQRLKSVGLLENQNRLKTTPEGRLLLNSVIAEIVAIEAVTAS